MATIAWAKKNAGVRMTKLKRVTDKLARVVRSSQDTRPNGQVDAFELRAAAKKAKLNKPETSVLFTAWAAGNLLGSDGGPAPWSPPDKSEVLYALRNALSRLRKFNSNRSPELNETELRKVNSQLPARLVELASRK